MVCCPMSGLPENRSKHHKQHRDRTGLDLTNCDPDGIIWLQCGCGTHCKGLIGYNGHRRGCLRRLNPPEGWVEDPRVAALLAARGQPVQAGIGNGNGNGNGNAIANANGNVVVDAGELDGIVLAELPDVVAILREGCFSFHKAWIPHVRQITLDLMTKAVSPDEDTATRNIAAMQLLAGVIARHYNQRGRGRLLSPIDFLRSIIASPDFARAILVFAVAEVAIMRRGGGPREYVEPTPDSLRARVESLMVQKRISLAASTLGRLHDKISGKVFGPPTSGEALQNKINDLHPAADHRDILPDMDEDPICECLQVTPDQIRDKIYRLDRGSAAGCTGWTYAALHTLGNDRGETGFVAGISPPNEWCVALTNWCNKSLRGEIMGIGRELMVTARIALIDKKGGGVRPIRIECSICRIFGAVAVAIVRASVGPQLQPLQHGGGLKHGADIGARQLDMAYFEGDAIVSIDLQNAFNLTRHNVIYEGLVQYFPGALKWFRWKYGGDPCPIRNNEGRVVAHTRTGVGQGDPWGSMLFEIAIQPTLLKAQQELVLVEAQHNRDYPQDKVVRKGKICAFEDDTSATGETQIMFTFAPKLAEVFQDAGFVVQVHKSYITGNDVDIAADAPAEFCIDRNGLVALGVAIGNDDYVGTHNSEKLREMAPLPMIVALRLLDIRTAISIIIHCIAARPGYILKTTRDLPAVTQYAQEFDNSMTQSIADLLGVPHTATFQTRCFLPRECGGLGIERQAGMRSESGQLQSRTAFLAHLHRYYPTEHIRLNQLHNYWSDIKVGGIEGVSQEITEIDDMQYDALDIKSCRSILALGKRKGDAHLEARLRDSMMLLELGSRQQLAYHLSTSASGMSFLESNWGAGNARLFSQEEFKAVVRQKLGTGPSNEPENTEKKCPCCRNPGGNYRAGDKPFHAASCDGNKGLRTILHNKVRDALASLIRKCLRLPANAVQLEKEVGVKANGTAVIADIVVQNGAEKWIVDVLSKDPGSDSAVARNSDTIRDQTAKEGEGRKRAHYRQVTQPAPLDPMFVFPFVLESTGRLGPAAMGFVQRVCGLHTQLKSQFYTQISVLCAVFMGRQLVATRDRYQPLALANV